MSYRITPTWRVDVPVYICCKVTAEDEDEAKDIADEAATTFLKAAIAMSHVPEEVEDWDFNANEADTVEMEDPDDYMDGPDFDPDDYYRKKYGDGEE